MVYKTKIINMLIRTTIFYILLSIWTIFLGILCIPYLLLPSKFLRSPILVWIKGIFIMLKKICIINHEIKGLNNVPNEPIIVVSKHQSAFETFALYYYLNKSFFIHKKQLFYIPIFGQYLMKANMLAIDREGKTKTIRKMIFEVNKRLNDGSSIIIFPEGTRTKPGETPNYKTGFIGIYKATNRRLLPVAVNSGLFWPKKSFVMKKGNIIIDIQKPIDNNLPKQEVLEKVKKSIESASNKLLL